MPSETRAIVGFSALGVVLVGAALGVCRVMPEKTGADALPDYVPAPASATAHARTSAPAPSEAPDAPRLFRYPTVSRTEIAFEYAGQIWSVPRAGGEARALVSGQLRDYRPMFSPDGTQVAFTGALDENADVYVVPAAGGEPRRLTYHPAGDTVLGWTTDGKRVLFRSMRQTARDLPQLFTVGLSGGLPDELPLASGNSASYSPDGQSVAYVPWPQWQPAWRKYRGGQTTPIWLATLADSQITKIPRESSNDKNPMWLGDSVYFLSDRNGPVTLFAYDVKGKQVREMIRNPDGFDIGTASAGDGVIVYEQMGAIHLYDVASGKDEPIPIRIAAELPEVRPRFEKVDPKQILHAALSPTGKRVLVETRGEILAVPVEKGDVRNLSRSPGAADRDPAWSPDGKWIAWLSDEGGEYALFLRQPDGLGPLKKVSLGDPPSFFFSPRWSPDSKKLVLTDKRLNLWLVDLERPTPVKLDTDRFDDAAFDPAWSPDSRFVAYAKQAENHFHVLAIYSVDDRKSTVVTDGRSDAAAPRFDRSGKELWFLASTDVGPAGAGSMVSMGRPQTYSVYGIVLQKDEPSPVAPESDEEGDTGHPNDPHAKAKAKDEKEPEPEKDKEKKAAEKPEKKKAVKPMKIDLDGIDQRIIALPIERANYHALEVGEKGILFLVAGPTVQADEDFEDRGDDESRINVVRFDLKTRKTEPFVSHVKSRFDGGGAAFSISADGKKALYLEGEKLVVTATEKGGKEKDETLKLDGAEVWVDPRAEWRQIWREVWRIERDYLYDPHAHGLDLVATEKLYGRYLDGIADRQDLNDLLEAALGNIVLGHVWASGGAMPHQRRVTVGLLGADYAVVDGHYRFARILRGENWNPKLRAPLTEPGVDVKEGEFLLAVNGEPLTGDDDIDRLLLERAGRQTVLKVGPRADGAGAREVNVVPTGSEGALRLRTWMEDNRKKVDRLSGGKLAYVYIPDTGNQGFANFNRYYYSQTGKDGVVLDERFNHGGHIADYIVEVLARTPLMGAVTREGEDDTVPSMAIFGPKVMIANQMSGSGGDALPWLFKRAGLGPLVGTRTWGGLVGIGGYPHLIDGGHITAPRWALYGIKGEWEVENKGIAPDVEVEQDPALERQGHDPQLEKAVELAMAALAKNPPQKLRRPAFPDYGDRLPKVPVPR